jgi:hypothetical protein
VVVVAAAAAAVAVAVASLEVLQYISWTIACLLFPRSKDETL